VNSTLIAQTNPSGSGQFVLLVLGFVLVALILSVLFWAKQYKRCPSNRILVVWGGRSEAIRCYHGGGTFVLPVLQGYEYLSLEPICIEIELSEARSLENQPVFLRADYRIAITTEQSQMELAASRLLGLSHEQIQTLAHDIILDQLRQLISTLNWAQINDQLNEFLEMVNARVSNEMKQSGLKLISMNLRALSQEHPRTTNEANDTGVS